MCQLCILKNACIKEISIALDLNKETLKSWIKKFCKSNSKAFYNSTAFYNPPKNKAATVMTCEKLDEIQELLNSGLLISEVSHNTGIKSCNVYKAIKDGKIKKFKKNNSSKGNIDNESERTRRNSSQPKGNFCLRTRERLDASKGLIKSAKTKFQNNIGVNSAGLLITI